MTIQIPENNLEVRDNGQGGIEMLLDGYDLAPHIESWSIAPDGTPGDPILTVTVRCKRVEMDVSEQPLPRTSFVSTGLTDEEVQKRITETLRNAGKEYR